MKQKPFFFSLTLHTHTLTLVHENFSQNAMEFGVENGDADADHEDVYYDGGDDAAVAHLGVAGLPFPLRYNP